MRGMASVSTGGRGERRAGYRVKNTTGGGEGMQPGKDRGREGEEEERIGDRELSEGEKGGKTKGAT